MGIRHFIRRLRDDTSGNALMLMAMGMPVLIGSSGMAVDVAQWYVWKRELQYAVDQAALAGAWASADPDQVDDYATLANLEFNDNLQALAGKVGLPGISYEDWNGGDDNTVVATSSYSRSLPFSSILWDNAVQINVRAQASFQAATNYTTCLLALDPDADDAFIIGGSMDGAVTCGIGSLSNSASAIRKNGSSLLDVSDLISAGGIDEDLAANGQIHEFISNLSNPYDGIEPPTVENMGSEYVCPTSTTEFAEGSSVATQRTRVVTNYTYFQGRTQAQAKTKVVYTGDGANSNSDITSEGTDGVELDFTPPEGGTVTVSVEADWTGRSWPSDAKKNTNIYEFLEVTTTNIYTNVTPNNGMELAGSNYLRPGIYSDITIGCDTTFNPGVYLITGVLDFGENHLVQGQNVLLVFTGAGGDERFKLNAKSKVHFTGITYDQLISTPYSMDAEDAELLNGMIIYDPNSTQDIRINGGADTIFDGILYMPKRKAIFNGNSEVGGSCMMLAAGTIELTGSTTVQSLCLPDNVTSFDIGGTTIAVRLVA